MPYLFISVLIIIVLGSVLWYIFFHENDPKSCFNIITARYLLSALIQSEAAVLAVVVAVTLVAVQFSAQVYSPRIVEYCIKSPVFLLLLALYIVVIIITAFFLIFIERLGDSMTFFVILCTFFGIICFSFLISYTYTTLWLLKPSALIRDLAHDITNKNLLEGDPVYPIAGIVTSSIRRYDLETVREGTRAIKSRIIDVLETGGPCKREEDQRISQRLIGNYLYRAARLAIFERDQESANELLSATEGIGSKAIEKGYYSTVRKSIWLLGNIGKLAANHSLFWNAKIAASFLYSLGTKSVDEVQKMGQEVTNYQKELIEAAKDVKNDLNSMYRIARRKKRPEFEEKFKQHLNQISEKLNSLISN